MIERENAAGERQSKLLIQLSDSTFGPKLFDSQDKLSIRTGASELLGPRLLDFLTWNYKLSQTDFLNKAANRSANSEFQILERQRTARLEPCGSLFMPRSSTPND